MKLMVLKKRGKLPQDAGGTPIMFTEGRHMRPRVSVSGRSILLPSPMGRSEFFPLQNGQQFLFVRDLGKKTRNAWFAGMDEQYPFVTRMPWRTFKVWKKRGEKAFYEEIRPSVITNIEELHTPRRAERQGDMWLFPMPYSWDELLKSFLIVDGKSMTPRRAKKESVLDSRHCLTGRCVENVYFSYTRCWLGEGVIEAPHHKPRVLKGPHLIARTWKCGD